MINEAGCPRRSKQPGVLLLLILAAVLALGRPGVSFTQSDLDDFMSRVLARRDENWKKLQQYLLDEREKIQVLGTGRIPLWGAERTYTWYIRDGFFVRSPLTANGVEISDADRRKYEQEFLRRAKAREGREKQEGQAPTAAAARPEDATLDLGGLLAQTRQPQFMDTAYFLRFKFEQGKYAFVGRESLEGTDVLRIEYYPARLFSHEQDAEDKRRVERRHDRKEDIEAAMERLMNKVSLVTLWVTPTTHQIVKYTFDNIHLDFLPAASFMRVSDLEATMHMGQPFKDIWLPRDVDIFFSAMFAVGSVDVRYHLDYVNYREAATSGRVVPPAPR